MSTRTLVLAAAFLTLAIFPAARSAEGLASRGVAVLRYDKRTYADRVAVVGAIADFVASGGANK
jgi:hypothetical protein